MKAFAVIAMTIAFVVDVICAEEKSLPDFLASGRTLTFAKALEAASKLTGDPRSATNRAEFVAANREVFDSYAAIADKPMEAPARSYDVAKMKVEDLMALRKLSFAMKVRAEAEEGEGNWAAAAREYLGMIRFGQKVEHGPMVNFMTGSAIELAALKPMETIISNLSASELSEMAVELGKCGDSRISIEEVLRREEYFMKMNPDPEETAEDARAAKASFERQVASVKERYFNTATYMEVIRALMACARFAMETKMPVTALSALVPKYLAAIPSDPYTGQPLRFKVSEGKALVYGVGANRLDDEGRRDDVGAAFSDQAGGKLMIEALEQAVKKLGR